MNNEVELNNLMSAIQYSFTDIKLLENALRHRSVGRNNNERLEFLGDSVLNCVIAKALFEKFPKLREGELSRLRAKLVCRDSLIEIAKGFELGEYITLGAGEKKSGGRHRESILSDAVEAVIGAMYLDSDFVTAQGVIGVWFSDKLADKTLREQQKDPKTELQEYLQSKHMSLPEYTVKSVAGKAHNQTFVLHCKVKSIDHFSEGKGRNRRTAEQDAADAFLKWLKKHGK